MIKKKLVVLGVVDMHQLLLKADVTQLLDSIIDENSTVLPDKICKDLFMQALVRIQNHCRKVNMQNILKPCEIYFHHVIHTDLFPYVCAKNQHLGGFQLLDLIITELKSHMTC